DDRGGRAADRRVVHMKRREFLLGRSSGPHAGAEQARPLQKSEALELSCEQLYMRFVDAEADGTTARLFDVLAQDLGETRVVRLRDTSWLARDDFKVRVDDVLAAFVARGGRVA